MHEKKLIAKKMIKSHYKYGSFQRPDQYKMKILVFSIQYDFQILKYQYSIWRILNKYQYAEKT